MVVTRSGTTLTETATLPEKAAQAKKVTLDQKRERSTPSKQTPTVTTPKGNAIVWPMLAWWVLLLYLAVLRCQWTWSTAHVTCTHLGIKNDFIIVDKQAKWIQPVIRVPKEGPFPYELGVFLTVTNTANVMWFAYNVFNRTSARRPAIVACLLALLYAYGRAQLSCP